MLSYLRKFSHNFSVAEQQRAALRRTLRDRLETEDFAPLDYMFRVLEDTASLLAQEQKLIGSKARTKTQENLIGAHMALAEQYIACARISTKTQPVQDKQKTKPASANRLERAPVAVPESYSASIDTQETAGRTIPAFYQCPRGGTRGVH